VSKAPKQAHEDQMIEVTKGVYSVALSMTEDAGMRASASRSRRRGEGARTEEEVVRGIGEMVAMMLDERREEAKRVGKTFLEMEV